MNLGLTPDTKLPRKGHSLFPPGHQFRQMPTEVPCCCTTVEAHGQTEMPIWGVFLISQTRESPTINPKDAAMITQGRVLSVVSYLESLQAE
jgi:hypothetical protein